MKNGLIAFVMMSATAACAVQNTASLKLAYQMQDAVLRTQDIQKIQELLKEGVDVNAPIGCGTFSPLDGAVQTQNVEMLKFLIAHGAKPVERQLARAAFASGEQQSLEMVRVLLKAGVNPNPPTGDTEIAALVGATYREHNEVVTLLLSQPGINLNVIDDDGETPLMCAARHGSSELVELLLHAGANPRVKNKYGETAVSVAEKEIETRKAIIAKLQTASK